MNIHPKTPNETHYHTVEFAITIEYLSFRIKKVAKIMNTEKIELLDMF